MADRKRVLTVGRLMEILSRFPKGAEVMGEYGDFLGDDDVEMPSEYNRAGSGRPPVVRIALNGNGEGQGE